MNNNKPSLEHVRHTLAHVLAQALLEHYPGAQLTLGPAVDDGFYYDVDFGGEKISEEQLAEFEATMKKNLPSWESFSHREVSADGAREAFKGNPYKTELINEIEAKGEKITLYTCGGFTDLCRGGHVESPAAEIPADSFKLDRVAGAYWRGDEKNKMLTRIYGLAFESKEKLDEYLAQREEAEKRDHRKLGKEMQLFAFDDEVGPGLPLWLPKGAIIVEELEKLAKEMEHAHGYDRVRSPHITKGTLYHRSGHLPYYADSMFPPMEMDGEQYYLKPMNCPHHHKIFAAVPKSYRDLPVRYGEYGHCYRYEDSGSLFGLMRVRSLCMNDAHIYCTPEQFEEEFLDVINMYLYYFKLFGIEKYQMRLSKHSKEGLGKKYVDEPELWTKTEEEVRKVLIKANVPFVEADDEAAFYGPKIDVQIWSAIGREFTLATNQLDFAVPKRFDLAYTDKDGTAKTPLCIHRAPLSTHERFIGFLIEHYAGNFPLWLAPVQVAVVPVSPDHHGE
jgi:threonyl-tRNA synthetase